MKKIIILSLTFLLTACTASQKTPDENIQVSNTPVVTKSTTANTVPLPSKEDIIRTFFALINEHRASEAVGMLSQSAVPDDSAKQSWGVQFNSFEKVEVKSIEPAGLDTYKVVLAIKMKPEAANTVIPNYGFDNGDNTRWVSLQKDSSGLWKLNGLSTGP